MGLFSRSGSLIVFIILSDLHYYTIVYRTMSLARGLLLKQTDTIVQQAHYYLILLIIAAAWRHL